MLASINYAIAERPSDMAITTNGCRGNFRSTWISSGGYEPVADRPRGWFRPLRFLPKGNKVVVVGLITSKFGELERRDHVKRRLGEAARFAPLEQLALSPQCGFASPKRATSSPKRSSGRS